MQLAINSAHARRVAWITKRATPVRITGVRKGRVVGTLTRSPGVDYVGTTRGGRAVYFEVKSCQHGTFSLQSIEPEQWAEMDRVRELGAGAWLVVFWRPATAKGKRLIANRSHAWCVIPWATVVLAKHEGHASLSAEVLARCAVLVDWIDVIASDKSR